MVAQSRLRMLADYLAATKNEIAVDEMFLALSNIEPVEVGYLPRVPRWINYAVKRPHLMRILSHAVRMIWLAGGFVLFFAKEYLKFYYAHYRTPKVDRAQNDGAVLGLSTRVCEVIALDKFSTSIPQTWLTLPWVRLSGIPEGVKELPLFSLLDKKDLLGALFDSLVVTQFMKRNRKLSTWVLQSYTGFRWFLVRRALGRLSGTLVTVEHYDRWAVLVDRSVRECRRRTECSINMVIVQHGAVGSRNRQEVIYNSVLNLPTRLQQVDILYSYSINEAAAFQDHIFSHGQNSPKLKINFFKPEIKLYGDEKSDRPRLLFVGHPLCESFHIDLFNKLVTWKNLEIYYKPHPKAPMSASIDAVEWDIIRDEKVFPRVDLLISYPSTLVIEYENVGICALIHPLNPSKSELTHFAKQVKNIFLSDM